MKRTTLQTLALAAACALAACSPGAAPPAAPSQGGAGAPPTTAASPAAAQPAAQPSREPTTVRITDIQITSAAGSYIAAEKGYFAEEGIDAQFLPMGAADQVPAIVANSADVAGAAINAFLFNAVARGVPVKGVADHGANLKDASAGGVVFRKDLYDSGAVRNPADFKGRKIGLSNSGSASDIALDRYLHEGGLDLTEMDLNYMGFPDLIPAFANKAIDAGYWQEPFTTIAVERGLVVRGPIGYDVYPNQQIAVVLFRDKLLTDRDLGLRYLRAYTRGVRDYVKAMQDHDPTMFDQVVPILIEHTTVKDRSLYEKAIPSGLKPDPIPNVQSISDDQEWYIAHGQQQERVNVQDFIDTSMIEEVIRQLGSAGR
ncbi:MAG TPA: ABC transporter substrate-binding protein [Chloroflexota bacterium]|nr:ABC transporter substrate-binding protein [Chloroflexota bacterium]